MTFVPGPRELTTPGLCGARTRQHGGRPCRNFGIRPSGRCRLHGGHSLRGIASPTFVHGRYSRDWLLRDGGVGWRPPPARVRHAAEAPPGCATPDEEHAGTPHATAGNPMKPLSMVHSGGGDGGTPGGPSFWWQETEWDIWVPDEAVAGPKTRQQLGQPPTPEEVGRAAAWCVRDAETDGEIARRLGIGRRTLARWKQRPEFVAAVAALQVWQAAEQGEGEEQDP
jgi:hypothetical protein